MRYLNLEKLNDIDVSVYQAQIPYPWVNPYGLLTEEGYNILTSHLPDISLFEKRYGLERTFGQRPHDKYHLIYHENLAIPSPWKDFIAELHGNEYRSFIERMFDISRSKYYYDIRWFYSKKGKSISPHCDGERKIGAHLFYLNTPETWDETWGGQTCVLDDGRSIDWKSNPEFSDFKKVISAKSIGNYSLVFTRTDHSWHGVEAITSPKDQIRKIFSVVFTKKPSFSEKVGNQLRSLKHNIGGRLNY